MINDIYDMDTQKKVRYASESSNASTSGYSTMSPNPTINGAAVLFSMPPSPAMSPATAALQSEFSHLNLPSNSSSPIQQTQYTTLQNAPQSYNFTNFGSYATSSITNLNNPALSTQIGNIVEYPSKLVILEQPTEKFRFRYKSEMHGTHGSLNGTNSNRTSKSFPKVELLNFSEVGVIRCSLFQTDIESPHSHQLVVRKDEQDICDPHDVYVSPDKGMVADFQNMGIIHTAKKYIIEELQKKKRARLTFALGRTQLSTREEQELRKNTEKEAKDMNLNQVRLCFEAFKIEEDQSWTRIAAPVYTHSINNRKSAQTGELRICRLSITTGSVSGGDDLILLVEKVSKKNIKVRFYELNEDEEIIWQAFGKFRESDVHHQYAIVCTTPAYENKDIDKPVEVFIELVRPSDDERSFPPVTFRYKPRDSIASRKRRRTCSTATHSSSSSNSMNSLELPKTLQEQTQMQPPLLPPASQQQYMQNQTQEDPSISKEFNKDQLLKNLINSEELQSMLQNSAELQSMCVDNNFHSFLEYDGVSSSGASVALDKHRRVIPNTSSLAGKLTAALPTTNNTHLQRILEIYQEGRQYSQDDAKVKLLGKQVSDIFMDYATRNDDFDSIMHDIVLRDKVQIGINVCDLLKFFNLQELLNTLNSNGESCLHCACLHNRAHFIRPLILLGCDPNIRDHLGNTALHIAVRESNKDCVDIFLSFMSSSKRRFDLTLTNDAGLTPLHLAIRSNALSLIEKLLRYDKQAALVCNTKDGNNALHMAVLQQNVPLIKLLMELHTVNLEARNTAGRTACDLTKNLDAAARKEILELLLETNAPEAGDIQIKEEEMTSSSSTEEEDEEEEEEVECIDQPLELVKSKVDAKLHNILSNEVKFAHLVKKLDINDNWLKLATLLKIQHLSMLWPHAHAMLCYVRGNVDNIGYNRFAEALEKIDKEAFLLLKNM